MTENQTTLLDLNDAAIEEVMAAVLMWCNEHNISMMSEMGQKAMGVAATRRSKAKLSVQKILTILTDEVQIS